MPLFSARREPSPEPVYEPEPTNTAGTHPSRKPSLFHRNRDPSPTSSHHTASTASSAGGIGAGSQKNAWNNYSPNGADHSHTHSGTNTGGSSIFRRSTENGAGTGRKGLFHRDGGNSSLDPSILQARERVMHAEAAEIEADRALGEARLKVREAKDHVWRLAEEAKEETRRAQIKQEHATEVTKRGKGLGRHGL